MRSNSFSDVCAHMIYSLFLVPLPLFPRFCSIRAVRKTTFKAGLAPSFVPSLFLSSPPLFPSSSLHLLPTERRLVSSTIWLLGWFVWCVLVVWLVLFNVCCLRPLAWQPSSDDHMPFIVRSRTVSSCWASPQLDRALMCAFVCWLVCFGLACFLFVWVVSCCFDLCGSSQWPSTNASSVELEMTHLKPHRPLASVSCSLLRSSSLIVR